jgi:16S rRNA (guanine527-N7)-methyltransferase
MTEDEARAWVRDRFGVSRETSVAAFAALLAEESQHQNLISASTLPQLWARHLVDSAQLVSLTGGVGEGLWVDIGSGAGLPGMVVAILTDRPVVLVEPRAKRAEFLRHAAASLSLEHRIDVQASKVETYRPAVKAAVVSARAVAELSALLSAAHHLGDLSTMWVLPKGRSAQSEVAAAAMQWHGSFHVEPSITQADAGIVVARGVQPR